MNMKIIWSLLFFFLPHAWDCGGGRSSIKHSVSLAQSKRLRSSTQSPIRIHYEYINFDLGSESLNTYFIDQLIPAADSFFKNTMRVNNLLSPLKLNEVECDMIRGPASHKEIGVNDTDLIIYISSEYNTIDGFVAYASPCELDPDFRDIPILGYAVINSAYFPLSDLESHFSTIVHEFYHIFGFNNFLFDYWKKPDGSSYPIDEIVETIEIRGTKKMILKTPNVLEKAREFFACESLKGVELEEYGGEETAGSHWDMRIMYNDFMMGKDISDPIYSSISLALLKDTGWFDVDYTYVTPPTYAYKAGCDFFEKTCLTNQKSNFPKLFCDDSQAKYECDTFHLRKSYCYLAKYPYIPKDFQYFSAGIIGGDSYADYCPVFTGYPDGNCRSENKTSIKTLASTDEVIGPHSRCFKSTLSRGNPLRDYSACYEVINCTDTYAVVQIGQKSVNCPFEGGRLKVDGYIGEIICPDSNILCKNFPCLNGCSGQGKCVDGVCHCDQGYGGDNCFLKIKTS